EMEAYVQQEKLMKSLQGKTTEAPDALMLSNHAVLEQESNRLSNAFVVAYDDFYGYKFGFIPAFHKSSFLNYFSCLFLHGGFLHILGNMLFLFLAGIAM